MKQLTQLQDISSKFNFKNAISSTVQLLHNCFTFNKLTDCHLYSSSHQLKNLQARVTATQTGSLSLFPPLSSSLTKPAIPSTTIVATIPTCHLKFSVFWIPVFTKDTSSEMDAEGLSGCLVFSTAPRKVHPNPQNRSRK